MPKYAVSFTQIFQAESKQDAHQQALAGLWNDSIRFGSWVQELPEGSRTVCVEVDPTTGIKHWEGMEG
jgi:hypothetical protein